MFRRLTALLLIGLLSMACALPALAEAGDLVVGDDVELAEGPELPELDIPEIAGLELPELSVEEPAAYSLANESETDEDQPIELIVQKNTTEEATVGLTYQIVVPGKTIKSCKSSDKKIATVTKQGLVKTKKAGTVKITITPKKGKKLVLTLKVKARKAPVGPYMIAHAMGGVNADTYSNSLEAFKENYAKGHRLFEVDLHFTSDGKLVLWHSWDYQFCSEHTPGEKPTYKAFMSSKIYDRYTPMDLKKLLKLMKEYPDIRVVIDGKYGKPDTAKREFKQIVSTAKSLKCSKVLDRMIVEVYNEDMYKTVKKIHDFPEYMMALYKIFMTAPTEEEFSSVAAYCKGKKISTLVIDVNWWNPNYVEIAERNGVKIALYTVNDPEVAQSYFDAGVTALFADFLPPV